MLNTLASELFRDVKPDFIRILAGALARLYIDVLDVLEQEASQRNEGMSREEALALAAEVIENHPDAVFAVEGDEDSAHVASLPIRDRARWILDRLIATGWLEEQLRADYQRLIFFDSNGAIMVDALRRIARPNATLFSDKLVGVCAALANTAALEEQPWEHVQSSIANVQLGLSELRSMRKSVERLMRRQVESQSLADNLRLLYDEYAEQIGRACYAELVRARLPSRLAEAQQRARDLLNETDLLHKMQAEVLRREPSLSPATAMSQVRNRLEDLARSLEMSLPLADLIDRRTAEFTRRSLARFRYLQEVVGERRSQIKQVFDLVNQHCAGQRLNDVNLEPEMPAMLIHDLHLLAGRDSLYEPPRKRLIEENQPIDEDPTEDLKKRGRLLMEAALRDSLSVGRANRFVKQIPGGKGSRIASSELPVASENDLADVIAMLLHAESPEAVYRVEQDQAEEDLDAAPRDAKAGCSMDRFYIVKK